MKQIDTDVLVIGAGAAGLTAAVTAAGEGSKVAVLSKGQYACCTTFADSTYEMFGGGGCGFSAPVIPPDNADVYYQDLLAAGGGRNTESLTALFADKSGEAFDMLLENGVRFKKGAGGKPEPAAEIRHSHPRLFRSIYGTGREIVTVLTKRAKSAGVMFLDNTMAFRLLLSAGEVAGCLAFQNIINQRLFIRTKSIVLATGGAGNVFPLSTNPGGITGDGIKLAVGAGAALCNMDLYSRIPMSVRPVYGIGMIPRLLFAGVEADVKKLMSSKKILWKYDPEKLCIDDFRTGFPATYAKLADAGFCLERDTLELEWLPHFMLGGVRIDTRARTSVPGLFAAGEVTGGVSGIERLPGTGIAEGIVFGEIAGRSAARFAKIKRYLPDVMLPVNSSRSLSKEEMEAVGALTEKAQTALIQIADSCSKEFNQKAATILSNTESETNALFSTKFDEFLPTAAQAAKVLKLISVLTFGKILVNEMRHRHGYESRRIACE